MQLEKNFNLGGKNNIAVFDSWKMNECNFNECSKIVNLKQGCELR